MTTETINIIRSIAQEASDYAAETVIEESMDALKDLTRDTDEWTQGTVRGLVSSVSLVSRRSSADMRELADQLEAFIDGPTSDATTNDPTITDAISLTIDAVRKAADIRDGRQLEVVYG